MLPSDSAKGPSADLAMLRSLYQRRWDQHGETPLALGWTKGKQDIRFDILLSGLPVQDRSFLDVGCGFGDLVGTLRSHTQSYRYVGLDMVADFIAHANEKYGDDRASFRVSDFVSEDLNARFDYVLASGIFGFKLSHMDNYEYIACVLRKMVDCATSAVAVNFLSDRVTFRRDTNFYANPGHILDIGLSLSRSVVLRHDYMPFEFSLVIFSEDGYDEQDTTFTRHTNAKRDR